jgi:uncharacterized protein
MDAVRVSAVREVHRRAAPWPYAGLSIPQGWRPTPIREVVLKVHQRCNLACDYCYVYTKADQTWRDRPAVMSPETRRQAIAMLARQDTPPTRIILHGGEPLLYGAARLGDLATEIRAALPDVEIGMQTNGVRLDATMLDVLAQHRVQVGVSLDGTKEDHDRHRLTPGGKGSFAVVARALELLRQYPENYAGILCTVVPGTDPIATYEALKAFAPPAIDLLMPHANWDQPPPENIGSWLVRVFDYWYADKSPPSVRLFEDIISLLLGGGSRSEQVGLSPSAVVVVETDGAIEQVDALKSAYEGACATGLDVWHDELRDALEDPGIVARQLGLAALSAECLACPVHRVCGGGHYAHRYRTGQGFRHQSVYCEDLQVLIEHVRARVSTDLASVQADEGAGTHHG